MCLLRTDHACVQSLKDVNLTSEGHNDDSSDIVMSVDDDLSTFAEKELLVSSDAFTGCMFFQGGKGV